MEVRAYSQTVGSSVAGSVTVPVAASMPAESRIAVVQLAALTGVSDAERTQLVQAVAAVDAGVPTASLRSDLLNHVAGLGIYLKNTSTKGWPRWDVLTALRAYGLNIEHSEVKAMAAANEQQVAQLVMNKLESLARSSRSVSLEQVAVVTQKQVSTGAVQVNEPSDSGSDEGESGAPETGRSVELTV